MSVVGAIAAPDWIGFGFLLFESEYMARSISEGVVQYFLRKLRINSKWTSENFEYHTFLLSNLQLKSMKYFYLFCIDMIFFVKMHGIIETGLKPTHFQIFVYLSSLKNSHSPKKKNQDFSQIRNTHIHN